MFGTAALIGVGLLPPVARPGSVPGAMDQGGAVAALLAQQEILLDHKLRRLQTLARRARDGLLLGPEVAARDHRELGCRLTWPAWIRPIRPCSGPRAGALNQDPRAALPRVTVTLAPRDRAAAADATGVPVGAAADPARAAAAKTATSSAKATTRASCTCGSVTARTESDPEPGATLAASYRTGNGTAGNVPAEAITALVSCTTRFDDITRVCNPLPAQGGADPEPTAAAQLYAPSRIGTPLRPRDYRG